MPALLNLSFCKIEIVLQYEVSTRIQWVSTQDALTVLPGAW